MGLMNMLTGTKHPASGVVPRPTQELRAALLALDPPEGPFTVREGALVGADVLAEWRVRESGPGTSVNRVYQIRLRLVPDRREVRALELQREVTRRGSGGSGPAVAAKWTRGPVRTVSKEWTVERGPDGRRRLVQTSCWRSSDMRLPLRDAVLAAGWTWRGVLFKL
ncbi:hypothetical protein [Streptomyces sp. NPDC090022]|uniref:hypothetical protein n=1 Tax=Streptomyces sp. NPDC090022 TaxID=3365920 RepID=UPI00380F7638